MIDDLEFYRLAYQGLDLLLQKVVEAREFAGNKYNVVLASINNVPTPKEQSTPTPKEISKKEK